MSYANICYIVKITAFGRVYRDGENVILIVVKTEEWG
jgi:hypothetical protein